MRVIYNLKQCGLNDACGLPEKVILHGIDYIAASLIRALAQGAELSGLQVCGKTFVYIHGLDRRHLRISILDPEPREPRLYGLNALPLGTTGSVAGFLRISAALFYILTAGLRVWCSAFFDDIKKKHWRRRS